MTRIGSLFSGYLGLDMAVEATTGATTAWVCDNDPGASRILEHRAAGVPNLGDITAVDWSAVEPVDIITGGFPCQDVSAAGKRAGMRPGTRSGLWSHMAYAIDRLRPSLVVAENVRGLLSAEAHSDLEPCPWCLGDGPGGALRALGAVLGDLAGLGYDASWYGLRAADVGAPHGRFRIFVVAYPGGDGAARDAAQSTRRGPQQPHLGATAGSAAEPREPVGTAPLLPTPRTSDTNGTGAHGDGGIDLRTAVSLLPTPWTAKMQALHGNGHGKSLAVEAQRLLPTPMVGDAASACNSTATRHKVPPTGVHAGDTLTDVIRGAQEWGQYADAIARWETILGRPAPAPTQTSTKGTPQLSPAFSEWMMGLPAGWVTDVPGLSRNQQLKALGNGVVPAQAEAALRFLLATADAAA